MVKPVRISVIGGSRTGEEMLKKARQAGREIASRDAVLVCGGLGGVMREACRGAAENGGITVGILPGENPESANSFVQIPIVTGMGEARNVIVAKSGDGVLAINGRYGTMTEIGFALKAGVPVAAVGEWTLNDVNPPEDRFLRTEDELEAVEWLFANL